MGMKSSRRSLLWLGLILLVQVHSESVPPQTCSVEEEEIDPALQEMKYDLGRLGNGEETFLAYVQPDVTSFYRDQEPPSTEAVVPLYTGFAGKFVNMSPRETRLYWDPDNGEEPALMSYIAPFEHDGTATYPGHHFFISYEEDPLTPLIHFHVKNVPENVFVFDPFHVPGNEAATERNLATLTDQELEIYQKMRRTVIFDAEYQKVTGRAYLANYLRPRPSHKMWRADYFGQEHWVTTRETHFVELPPSEKLQEITAIGKERKFSGEDARILSKYREDKPLMNMTLTALSCAPRVFEIPNFLSKAEVDHIMQLALGEELHSSATGDYDGVADAGQTLGTRTSFNSWLRREQSPILDAVYRRAADLLRIDEALLRFRSEDEYPTLGTRFSIAEQLQLVHYSVGQAYDAHHDFGYPKVHAKRQNERFATILFYLNEGMIGGETAFPRWANAETESELLVIPEVGKAILFYSQLPDGNLDDLSQHVAHEIEEGEKWLINLWVWDEVYEEEEGERG